MDSPVVTVNPDDNKFIKVVWIEPYNGSDAIIEYKVLFKSVDKQYYTTTECVSAVPTLTTECLVAMTTLMAPPFSLTYY